MVDEFGDTYVGEDACPGVSLLDGRMGHGGDNDTAFPLRAGNHVFGAYDPSDIHFSRLVFKDFRYRFPYLDGSLRNALRFQDLFLTVQVLREAGTRGAFLCLSALIGDTVWFSSGRDSG